MRTALVLLGILTVACGSPASEASLSRNAQASPKLIPMTTASPQARERSMRAIELMWHNRPVEALHELDEALKLDPNFVQAQALHGDVVRGAEGAAELEKAAGRAASLPEPERLFVERAVAIVRNDQEKAHAAAVQLTQSAPDDWRSFGELGTSYLGRQKYDDAAQAFRRVIELNPKIGVGSNMLGYALLQQDDLTGAIDAFKQYVAAAPTEANAQDSLADALMTAGRFEESEAAFRKAAELDPQFYSAWEGIAFTKFFRRDWAGGRDALARAMTPAVPALDRAGFSRLQATAAFAAGSPLQAIAAFDNAAQMTGLQPSDVVFIELQKARLLLEMGKPRDAMTIIASVLERVDSGKLLPAMASTARRRALLARSLAEAATRDAAAAEGTSRALEMDATGRPDDVNARSAATLSAAMAAVAKGDYSAARDRLASCLPEDYYCRYQQVIVTRKSGDGAAAGELQRALLKSYRRDSAYLLAWTRLNGE